MRRCPTYLEFEIDFLLGNKEILILAADIHDSVIVSHQGEIAPQVEIEQLTQRTSLVLPMTLGSGGGSIRQGRLSAHLKFLIGPLIPLPSRRSGM